MKADIEIAHPNEGYAPKVFVDDFCVFGEIDTEGIQKAFDSVSGAKRVNYSPEVIFTPGRTYYIDHTIMIRYGVRVTAHGADIKMMNPSVPAFQFGTSDRKCWHPLWEGGTITMNSGYSESVGFFINNANHGRIKDVRIGRFDIGISLTGDDPVQWEIDRCFLSNNRCFAISADGANVLKITGGKYNSKKHNGTTGIYLVSCASVIIESVDLSFFEGGAISLNKCSRVTINSVYIEKNSGLSLNRDSIIEVNSCKAVSINGTSLNCANGAMGDDTHAYYGIKVSGSDGVVLNGVMSYVARGAFLCRDSYSDVVMNGCVDVFFQPNYPPRVVVTDQKATNFNYITSVLEWDLVRGEFDSYTGDVKLLGTNPEDLLRKDLSISFVKGSTLRLNVDLSDVYYEESGNDSETPIINLRIGNKRDFSDSAKVSIPLLSKNELQTVALDWTPESDGDLLRVVVSARRGWPGFSGRISTSVLGKCP